jgi:hypothetical protein
MLSLGFFLTWIAIALIGIGLLFFGLNIMPNPWVCLGAGMITIASIMMVISGIFTHHPNDAYSEPHYANDSDEESDNKDDEADDVTSETEGSPDNGYKCTIRSRIYGTIWGFGQTAEEAEEDAHRQYEYCKSKW